ncbi:hypothetical protein chiPu_0014453 [Chiloscyllium punctatum]|uniref:Uncharacterized protein n=1 Tax=Chiloscyllium punctatum TaxID=137246 RepID=A0A401SZY9_CHIPU|nr:hypothetical protein [Chiloscyllium punctatum]
MYTLKNGLHDGSILQAKKRSVGMPSYVIAYDGEVQEDQKSVVVISLKGDPFISMLRYVSVTVLQVS